MRRPRRHPTTDTVHPLVDEEVIVHATGVLQDLRHRTGPGRRPQGRRPVAAPRRDGRGDGAERLRQDHAAQLPVRHRRDRRRPGAHRGREPGRAARPGADAVPRRADGLRVPVLQPDAGAVGGRERRDGAAARGYAAARGPASGPRGAGRWWAWPTGPTTCPRRCPAASASGSRSPARSSTTRPSCGPTSRPATSTARPPRAPASGCRVRREAHPLGADLRVRARSGSSARPRLDEDPPVDLVDPDRQLSIVSAAAGSVPSPRPSRRTAQRQVERLDGDFQPDLTHVVVSSGPRWHKRVRPPREQGNDMVPFIRIQPGSRRRRLPGSQILPLEHPSRPRQSGAKVPVRAPVTRRLQQGCGPLARPN